MAFNFAHLLPAACDDAARRLRALRAAYARAARAFFLSFSQCNFTEKCHFVGVFTPARSGSAREKAKGMIRGVEGELTRGFVRWALLLGSSQ